MATNLPTQAASRIPPVARPVFPDVPTTVYAKAVTIDYAFKAYELTEEEESSARQVPPSFVKLLHTMRTEVALAKLRIQPEMGDTSRLVTNMAYLDGQLSFAQQLLDTLAIDPDNLV